MERVILHADLNNFYASVECLYHPELRGKPVAVAGDPALRHGIVLAKNMMAKRCGVTTGEPLWQAQRKCPEITFLRPHFDRYLQFSQAVRSIYGEYTDQVEPFGLDECWLDVTGSGRLFGDGKAIADILRQRVRQSLGVTISVGVSYNKIFAKLGSDLKKPDATTSIPQEKFRQIVWPLPVSDLLFVGPATTAKLNRYGVRTIGELARSPLQFLEQLLGKNGGALWRSANGLDRSPVAKIGEKPPVKSVGHSTTLPRDLVTDHEVYLTLAALGERVSARLRGLGLVCKTVQLSVRDSHLSTYERQTALEYPNRTAADLCRASFALFCENRPRNPVRSLGIRACQLAPEGMEQTSFYRDVVRLQKQEALETAVDALRQRYGKAVLRRGGALLDPSISGFSAEDGKDAYLPSSFVRQ